MQLLFVHSEDASLLLQGNHHMWLVALSVSIAIFTACMALHIAGIAQALTEPRHRNLARLAGTVTLGGGIWAMHFIGMLALDLGTAVNYHLGYTLLSMLPALLASWVTLRVVARTQVGARHIVLGGVLVGGGIGTMHYSGMAAMQMGPVLHYQIGWFLLSIAAAIALAMLALWIRFGLRGRFGRGRRAENSAILVSGTVMGLAIASMHYLGILATHFTLPTASTQHPVVLGSNALALQIALATVLVTIAVTAVSYILLRYRTLYLQMRASESQYVSLLLNIPGLAYRRRLDTRELVFVSDGALPITGWTAQECMADGRDFRDQIHPDDALRVFHAVEHARIHRLPYETEYQLVHRDGSVRWVLSRGSVVGDKQGLPCWFDGLITDITERKAIEQALHTSESQHRTLLRHIPGLAFRRELTAERKIVFVSDGVQTLTGWPAADFIHHQRDLLDHLHPDDRDRVMAKINQPRQINVAYEHEYRLVHRDGSVRWVLSRGSIVADDSGTPRWFDGMMTDITERKTAEQALTASQLQMQSMTHSIPGIVLRALAGEQWRIQYMSDAVSEIAGWSVSAFLSGEVSLPMLTHPDDRPQVLAQLHQALLAHTTYDIEHRLQHRDGHYFWVWARGSATYDDQGQPLWVDGIIMDITERMETKQALHDSERQLQSLIRNIPGIVARTLVTPRWPTHYISAAVEAFTGYPAAVFMAGEKAIAELVHPDDWNASLLCVQQAIANHTSYVFEYRLGHRDGSYRWVWCQGSASYEEAGKPVWVDSITLDISERKAIENALGSSEAQVTSLIRSIPGIVLRAIVKDGWPIQFISSAIESFTGYAPETFMSGSLNLATLIHPDDLAALLPIVGRAITNHSIYSIEYRLRYHDGSYRWVWGRGAATYDAHGQPLWIDAFIMDIHERHAMEAALREAKLSAEAAAQSKTSFLANMSHEIRTPMNAIIGFTELLLGTDLSQLQRRHMTTVRQSARSLLGLLNDILDTAKLEKGAVELEHQDFSLKALLTEVADAQRLTAESKGLDLEVHYPPTLPEFFKGDAMRVQQVLTNLLGNAVKFTHAGSVHIRMRMDLGLVHITVTDTGIGISEERIDKIFDPFSQADASMSRRFGGTGLGTTIARQLVELMGGQLQVESTLDVGSSFHIRLPLQPGQRVEAVHDVLLYELPGLRILAVDDVPQNLELLSLALGQAGHMVTTATGGIEAVQAFLQQTFDIVLMDVQMPGVDGLEATRRIRQVEKTRALRATPIVALTASVMEDDRRATTDAGMNGFATKPLDMPQLFAEMARVMGIQLPDAEGATTHAIRHDQSRPPAIDWERGTDLWGNAATLGKAIRRFLDENQPIPLQISALLKQNDLDAARYLAHKLRGAAGNLCLQSLLHSSSMLEDTLKSDHPEQARLALEDVSAAMTAVCLELSDTEETAHPPATAPAASTATVPHADPGRCLALAQAMQRATLRNELDEATLEQLSQALHSTGQGRYAPPLEAALMAFEFDTAQTLLDILLEALAAQAKETTP